jgi:hypothetical protein
VIAYHVKLGWPGKLKGAVDVVVLVALDVAPDEG